MYPYWGLFGQQFVQMLLGSWVFSEDFIQFAAGKAGTVCTDGLPVALSAQTNLAISTENIRVAAFGSATGTALTFVCRGVE